MRKKFLPFAPPCIAKNEINEVIDTLKSGWLTTGPKTHRFEKALAKYIGARYTVALNSCTAGLHLALAAIGIKRGDEVIVPTMTFTATAEVITYFGARPVFSDVERDTLNIDLGLAEGLITKKTKAIIPVHIGGHPADIDRILRLAKKHEIKVVWDAAHAFSATYKSKKIGAMPDITCFSFYVTKPITTGEGGMVTANNREWAEKIRILSLHGIGRDAWKRYAATGSWYYEVIYPGFKYNLTDIASSIGIWQLKKSEEFRRKREKIAQTYNNALGGISELEIPPEYKLGKHAWHLYIIKLNLERLTAGRNQFIEELKKRNIGTSVHFIPLHIQPYYKKAFGYKTQDFPVAYNQYKRIISLPIYPKMTARDIQDVIWAVKDVIKKYKKP